MAIAPELSGHLQAPYMVDLQQRSMWPSTTQALMKIDKRRQLLQPTTDLEQLLQRDNTYADEQKFEELMKFSKAGISHRESLARLWKNKQANAVGLLREQLDSLQQRRIESERKKKEILDEHAAECFSSCQAGDEEMLDPVSIGEGFICDSEAASSWSSVPDSVSSLSEFDGVNSSDYWKEKAKALDTLLSESLKREEVLSSKLQESASEMNARLSKELQQQFERFDNFLRFTLRKAPVVFGHQDTELRYRFIHNAFPTLTEEEVIGKTDEEIYQGMGVPELMEFKREVIRTKVSDKQEIKFNTNLFGCKTFMIAVEPVLDTDDVCVGVNYVAMDVTLQVAKREKLSELQAEEAVQTAMESELNKTIYITEETMRAKQMLATMSHEIRSPLSGVISMASVLARTPLNEDQKLKVEIMMNSGKLVMDLINDILDLSRIEAGAMTLESKKFRPREVVRHVLDMASAVVADSKNLQLETDVSEDVPLEVVGDVLRIRQVLTNLVSNAVKFTHEGKVLVIVRVVGPPSIIISEDMKSKEHECNEAPQQSIRHSTYPISTIASSSPEAYLLDHTSGMSEPLCSPLNIAGHSFPESKTPTEALAGISGILSSGSRMCFSSDCQDSYTAKTAEFYEIDEMVGEVNSSEMQTGEHIAASSLSLQISGDSASSANKDKVVEDIVWLEFHIVDTGIGISESAIPTLFNRFTQASNTHARIYGGTGLGLHICKQLVELMGGSISVHSKEKEGSTFSFKLPLRTVQQMPSRELSSDAPESVLWDVEDHDNIARAHATASLRVIPKKPSRQNHSLLRSNVHARRNSKSHHIPRAAKVPALMTASRGSPSTALHSQKRERHSTRGAVDIEPSSAIETKPEESGHCFRPDGLAQKINPGSSEHAPCQCPGALDSEGDVKSHDCFNDISTDRLHAESGRKCSHYRMRSPPGHGNARKIGKTQYFDRSAGVDQLPATSTGMRSSRRLRILVAEDDPVNVKVTTHMLAALGHELKVVNNGADAVQAVQQGAFDVVLMDVRMPIMDGMEATRLIRSFEESCQRAPINNISSSQHGATAATSASNDGVYYRRRIPVPIIAMTADAMGDNSQECLNHGMNSFIAKPVNLAELEKLLLKHVPIMDSEI